MQESGVIDARPKRPALSVGDPCLNPGAAMVGGLVEIMGMVLQAGSVDVGFLSGSQVDKYGNINTTVIGDYEKPIARLPGSGGANPIGSLARKTLIITLHDKRPSGGEKSILLPHRGYLDGAGAREKWGMAPGTGPEVIITNKAVLRFDAETKEAYLASYHPDCTIAEIIENTPWELKVAEDVHPTKPPTQEELRVLREILDPHRMISIYEKKGYV